MNQSHRLKNKTRYNKIPKYPKSLSFPRRNNVLLIKTTFHPHFSLSHLYYIQLFCENVSFMVHGASSQIT